MKFAMYTSAIEEVDAHVNEFIIGSAILPKLKENKSSYFKIGIPIFQKKLKKGLPIYF